MYYISGVSLEIRSSVAHHGREALARMGTLTEPNEGHACRKTGGTCWVSHQSEPLDTACILPQLKIPLRTLPSLFSFKSGNADLDLPLAHLKIGAWYHLSQFTQLVSITTPGHYLSWFEFHFLSIVLKHTSSAFTSHVLSKDIWHCLVYFFPIQLNRVCLKPSFFIEPLCRLWCLPSPSVH